MLLLIAGTMTKVTISVVRVICLADVTTIPTVSISEVTATLLAVAASLSPIPISDQNSV